MRRTLCLAGLLLLLLPRLGLAQVVLLHSVIAGGGGLSQTAVMQAGGTLGQPVAGGVNPLIAGFWNQNPVRSNVPVPALILTSSANPGGYLASLVFTATVQTNGQTAANATGVMVFLTNGVPFSTNLLAGGSAASPAVNQLPRAATNRVQASYRGDLNYAATTASLIQVVTNHPPVAAPVNLTRTAGLNLIIYWSQLTNAWSDPDGDAVTLAGLNLVTANSVTVRTNGVVILYPNPASLNLSDQITYAITDGQGGTNTGLIQITTTPFVAGQQTAGIQVSGGVVTASFLGIPGYVYETQRSTNLSQDLGWVNIATNTVGASGQFHISDSFPDLGGQTPGTAYYRLAWHP